MTEKIRRYKFGLFAEKVVKFWYQLRFYNFIESRYKNFAGEIDLIFCKGKKIVFVEVKARASKSKDYNLISEKQVSRIIRAAQGFLSNRTEYQGFFVRFDLVLIKPFRFPETWKNFIIDQ